MILSMFAVYILRLRDLLLSYEKARIVEVDEKIMICHRIIT